MALMMPAAPLYQKNLVFLRGDRIPENRRIGRLSVRLRGAARRPAHVPAGWGVVPVRRRRRVFPACAPRTPARVVVVMRRSILGCN